MGKGDIFNQSEVNTSTKLEDVLAHCGHLRDVAPESWMLELLAASQSLPLLFFGVVFAIPSLKQLRLVVKNKLSSVIPATSSMASSAQ